MSKIILTNHALKKLNEHGLAKSYVSDVISTGKTEKADFGGQWNAVKAYSNYEVGVNYLKEDGKIKVISVWKRNLT